MKPVMIKMSPKLILSAIASTLATAVLALSAPAVTHAERNGAGPIPAFAELPAPSVLAR